MTAVSSSSVGDAAGSAGRLAERRVVTFGTYDLFHYGHLRIIERARAFGNWLAVGVSSDELNLAKKGIRPHFSFAERAAIVGALRVVDHVFREDALERKREYLREMRADVLVMGDDWAGRFDEFRDIVEVIYLPRTPAISTTGIVERIRGDAVPDAAGQQG